MKAQRKTVMIINTDHVKDTALLLEHLRILFPGGSMLQGEITSYSTSKIWLLSLPGFDIGEEKYQRACKHLLVHFKYGAGPLTVDKDNYCWLTSYRVDSGVVHTRCAELKQHNELRKVAAVITAHLSYRSLQYDLLELDESEVVEYA